MNDFVPLMCSLELCVRMTLLCVLWHCVIVNLFSLPGIGMPNYDWMCRCYFLFYGLLADLLSENVLDRSSPNF